MTKNTLLNIAIFLSRLLKIALIITTIGLSGLFVYAQIYKETFEDKEIVLRGNASFVGVSNIQTTVWKDANAVDYDMKPYTFGKVEIVSLYMNFFKALIVAVLLFLILRNFERIMLSVKSIKTFSRTNVKRFRQIGIYVVFVSILMSYTVLRFENGNQTISNTSLAPIIYVVLAFVMAEIFKEGEGLREENDLTI